MRLANQEEEDLAIVRDVTCLGIHLSLSYCMQVRAKLIQSQTSF